MLRTNEFMIMYSEQMRIYWAKKKTNEQTSGIVFRRRTHLAGQHLRQMKMKMFSIVFSRKFWSLTVEDYFGYGLGYIRIQ